MEAPSKADKFSLSYSLWAGAFFLLGVTYLELNRAFNLSFLFFLLIFTLTCAALLAWLIGLIFNAIQRRWRRAVSVLAAPGIAYAFFAALGAAGLDTTNARFELTRPYYLAQIAQTSRTDNKPRFKLFAWGEDGGIAGPNIFYTLIFDESDEIARPAGLRSREWNDRVEPLCPGTQMCSILGGERRDRVEVRELRDHFFLVTE